MKCVLDLCFVELTTNNRSHLLVVVDIKLPQLNASTDLRRNGLIVPHIEDGIGEGH